jgi:hypothetical protein
LALGSCFYPLLAGLNHARCRRFEQAPNPRRAALPVE